MPYRPIHNQFTHCSVCSAKSEVACRNCKANHCKLHLAEGRCSRCEHRLSAVVNHWVSELADGTLTCGVTVMVFAGILGAILLGHSAFLSFVFLAVYVVAILGVCNWLPSKIKLHAPGALRVILGDSSFWLSSSRCWPGERWVRGKLHGVGREW